MDDPIVKVDVRLRRVIEAGDEQWWVVVFVDEKLFNAFEFDTEEEAKAGFEDLSGMMQAHEIKRQ